MKRILTVLFALLAVAALGAQDFIINNGAEPQSLDPSHIQGVPEHRIYMSLFEGLVINDPKTCRALPGVAQKWSVSPDGMTVTFTLRKNAKWSDGSKVTASDFVDGWLRTLAPETGAEYAYMIGMIVKGAEEYNGGNGKASDVGVKAINDTTLEVQLKSAAPYAIDMMTHYAFSPLPMKAIAKYGDEWIKPGKFVGNGPFVLKDWKPQQYVLVEKSKTYWDNRNVKLKTIKFLPIEDNKTAYNMYKNGETDWNTGVALDLLDEIKLRKDYQVAPQVATYYYIFNTTRAPLTDVRVRKALSMSVDKKTLVDKITKGGQIVADAISPAMPPYVPPKGNPFNVEQAKKLLAEAGYPNGQGFPKLTVIYNTNDGHKKIAEYIQQQWKNNLGIDISLQNQEWKTFLDTRSNSHDFEIARAGWVGDYLDPNTFLDMFIKGSGNNDGLYDNPKYDELIKKAPTLKGDERYKAMQQAEGYLIDQDQAIMPLYYYVEQNLIDTTKWNGWYNNPLGIHNWKFISKK